MGWSDFTLLKTELPCEQATPLLGAYTKEKKSEYKRDVCMTMFLIVVLFLTAETWNQPRCPTIDEQIQ